MYSTKEKLRILRELNNPAAVGADLALLRTVAPDDPRMVKFDLSPARHAEEILLSLLEHFTREEIVANRRAFFRQQEKGQTKGETKGEKTPDADIVETEKNPSTTYDNDSTTGERANKASENDVTAAASKKKSAKKRSTRA